MDQCFSQVLFAAIVYFANDIQRVFLEIPPLPSAAFHYGNIYTDSGSTARWRPRWPILPLQRESRTSLLSREVMLCPFYARFDADFVGDRCAFVTGGAVSNDHVTSSHRQQVPDISRALQLGAPARHTKPPTSALTCTIEN